MRVLVCGGRDYARREPIAKLLYWLKAAYGEELVLIHGAARGADTLAAEEALRLHIAIDKPPTGDNPLGGYPADWKRHHRAAGPIRNRQMLVEGKPDMVFGFSDDIARSNGTADMLSQAMRAGVRTYLYGRDIIPIRIGNTPMTL